MPKKINNVFDERLTFIKLINASYKAGCNKGKKKDVILNEMNLETNISNLLNDLREGKYIPSKYRCFTIFEPKERLIKSLPFKDRIVHMWYVEEFIKPFIVPKFIDNSFACIIGRGTHKGVKCLQSGMRKMNRMYKDYYIVKCDISKYFYSVDKTILFNIIKKHFSDKKLINLTKTIIFDTDENKGIPIGNYTSQYFANIYLNELDYYVKHTMKTKYYYRYMDDFVLLVKDKKDAKKAFNSINCFIKDSLNLSLNKKSKYYPSKFGCDFLGYKIFNDYKLIRKNSKIKMKRKIDKWNKEYLNGSLDLFKVNLSLNSWYAHISHADSYRIKNKITSNILFK